MSAGFCSVKYWTNKIEKNVFDLIQAIHDEIIFDFEENYEQLITRFRHMSLFSDCLHFLRCRRSSEKKQAIVNSVQGLGKIVFMILTSFRI